MVCFSFCILCPLRRPPHAQHWFYTGGDESADLFAPSLSPVCTFFSFFFLNAREVLSAPPGGWRAATAHRVSAQRGTVLERPRGWVWRRAGAAYREPSLPESGGPRPLRRCSSGQGGRGRSQARPPAPGPGSPSGSVWECGGTAGTSCVIKDLPCQLWTRDAPHLCPEFLSQPYASSVASFRFNIVLFNVSLLTQGSKGSCLGHHLVAESLAVQEGGLPGSSEVTHHQISTGRGSLPLLSHTHVYSPSHHLPSPVRHTWPLEGPHGLSGRPLPLFWVAYGAAQPCPERDTPSGAEAWFLAPPGLREH